MAGNYDEYKAQQYYNFDDEDYSDGENGYFDEDHERLHSETVTGDPFDSPGNDNDETLVIGELDKICLSEKKNLRKSMSTGDLPHKLRSGKVYSENMVSGKSSKCTTNTARSSVEKTDTSSLQGNTSKATKMDTINRLAQPKRYRSAQNINEGFTLAEAVNKFHKGTPKRFHMLPKVSNVKTKPTVPHSPKLTTAIRNRPLHTMSFKQQEDAVLEEAKRTQFKANPINKSIFKRPVLNVKPRKSTVPAPFSLTSIKKDQEAPVAETITSFHAKPIPKATYKQPLLKVGDKLQLARPSINQVHHTKPLPFSFESRDKNQKSKREALVQEIMEAEKKAREFHAKPLPKCILKPSQDVTTMNTTCKKKISDQLDTTIKPFKARPATVLHKKPYEPKIPSRPLLDIDNFTLNTDLRSQERKLFESVLEEKQRKIEQLRQEEERLKRAQEEEEIQRARKQAEFKANEVKKYKAVNVNYPNTVTVPKSPKFHSHKNRSENKENSSL